MGFKKGWIGKVRLASNEVSARHSSFERWLMVYGTMERIDASIVERGM